MADKRAQVTRRVGFSAAHRYHRPEWDEARNRAAFGDNVLLHGHNYLLEATLSGRVDPDTGMAADIGRLDALLAELAHELGYQELSQDHPRLAGRIPTTENLALVAWDRIAGRTGDARLVRIRLFESPDLYVEIVEEPGT